MYLFVNIIPITIKECVNYITTVIKETGFASLGFKEEVTFELELGEWVVLGLEMGEQGDRRNNG